MGRGAGQVDYFDDSLPVQQRLFKSIKLWSHYVDLEESMGGSVQAIRAAYDRMLELKICTPQIIINYATFLEEQEYFEDSFRVYERGIELFGFPIAFDIWNIYLKKFTDRYVRSFGLQSVNLQIIN
jgi:pre-mRNA-splicing factor SYF1